MTATTGGPQRSSAARYSITAFGRPLWGDVFEELRERIVSGALAPGERLVEQDIATEFDISRGPVRSALAELDRVGLVKRSPRRGAEIVSFRSTDIIELYQIREALEVFALCTMRESDVAAISPSLRTQMELAESFQIERDFRASVDADLEFHRRLCYLSSNRRLVEAWETQAEQIRVIMAAAHRTSPDRIRPVIDVHQNIFEAIIEHRVTDAREALVRHLRDARDLLIASDWISASPQFNLASEIS